MWYAYAIAKEETKWEGGEIYYNQFFARGMQVNRKQASGESIEHWKLHRWDQGRGKEGIPNWNDDAGGPGGFGIKQVTGWLGQVNPGPGDVPREVIWNWKKNIDGGLNEMIKKHNEARTYMQKQRAASSEPVPAHKVENVIFTDGTARTMEDAVAIKAYNGSSKSNIPDPDNEPEPRSFFYTNKLAKIGYYCYWDKSLSKWSLSRYNYSKSAKTFNYVKKVCLEIEL